MASVKLATTLPLFLALVVVSTRCQSLRKLGQIHAPHAAFASLVQKESIENRSASVTLVISAFNPLPFFHDTIYEVAGIGQYLDRLGDVRVAEVSRDVVWPNEIRQVPHGVFNTSSTYILAAGGFLVPLKDHGTLTLFDLDLRPPVKHVLSDNSEDAKWFYHRVLWADMNGDGLMDIVTCRARTHLFGSTEGQLVWFEHPRQNELSQTWRSHVIANGPDTFFTMTSLPAPDGDVSCIITAGYFSHSLNVYWTTHPQGRWDDLSKILYRVIDKTLGAVFDVTVADVNLDGTLDLLVTNNALKNASIFAFAVPRDFRKDSFPRRTLFNGYTSRTSGAGHGAPGTALLVRPSSRDTSHKPLIVVSGDDDGQAHLLVPSSNAVSDWSYQQTTFLDAGVGTVGGIAAGDVDGDGYNEVFVPWFSAGEVHVFTFKP